MSELVTNAIEHARTPLLLLVTFTGTTVRMEVSDGSQAAPQLQPFDSGAPRGRGLQFVDALARAWSWRTNENGKTVWAEMAAVDPSEQPSGDLADHSRLPDDADRIQQAEQPRRAP